MDTKPTQKDSTVLLGEKEMTRKRRCGCQVVPTAFGPYIEYCRVHSQAYPMLMTLQSIVHNKSRRSVHRLALGAIYNAEKGNETNS